MASHADVEWSLPKEAETWQQVEIALLMDLRRELRKLNSLLGCHNAVAIPSILRQIETNTSKYVCTKHRPARSFRTWRGMEQHLRRVHRPSTSSRPPSVAASR